MQAPYREPVLPPPDFDPDSLELGVGVPIEDIVAELAAKKAAAKATTTTTTPLPQTAGFGTTLGPSVTISGRTVGTDVIRGSTIRSRVEEAIAPFRAEVVNSQDEEYNAFMEDVNQFIR